MAAIEGGDVIAHTIMSVIVAAVNPSQETLNSITGFHKIEMASKLRRIDITTCHCF